MHAQGPGLAGRPPVHRARTNCPRPGRTAAMILLVALAGVGAPSRVHCNASTVHWITRCIQHHSGGSAAASFAEGCEATCTCDTLDYWLRCFSDSSASISPSVSNAPTSDQLCPSFSGRCASSLEVSCEASLWPASSSMPISACRRKPSSQAESQEKMALSSGRNARRPHLLRSAAVHAAPSTVTTGASTDIKPESAPAGAVQQEQRRQLDADGTGCLSTLLDFPSTCISATSCELPDCELARSIGIDGIPCQTCLVESAKKDWWKIACASLLLLLMLCCFCISLRMCCMLLIFPLCCDFSENPPRQRLVDETELGGPRPTRAGAGIGRRRGAATQGDGEMAALPAPWEDAQPASPPSVHKKEGLESDHGTPSSKQAAPTDRTDSPPAWVGMAKSLNERLKALDTLKAAGVVREEEYEAKRSSIIGTL